MKTKLLLVLAILLRLTAFGCKCEELKPLSKTETDAYEFIFTGKVVAVQQLEKNGVAKFTIQAMYKGKSYPETEVMFDNQTDCQMSFSVGETWVIYAIYKEYGKPELKFCSRSRKLQNDVALDTDIHGMSFTAELDWLKKNLGVQALNVKKESPIEERELFHPSQKQSIWLYVGGLVALAGIWLLVRKFLK